MQVVSVRKMSLMMLGENNKQRSDNMRSLRVHKSVKKNANSPPSLFAAPGVIRDEETKYEYIQYPESVDQKCSSGEVDGGSVP